MKPLYTLSGNVIHGTSRGKNLGFPTANSLPTSDVPDGIYASQVRIENQIYNAATFVGAAITFNETQKKIESYLFDFSDDIYNKPLTIYLYKKIRDNKRFPSQEALVAQMQKDERNIKRYFTNNTTTHYNQ